MFQWGRIDEESEKVEDSESDLGVLVVYFEFKSC